MTVVIRDGEVDSAVFYFGEVVAFTSIECDEEHIAAHIRKP